MPHEVVTGTAASSLLSTKKPRVACTNQPCACAHSAVFPRIRSSRVWLFLEVSRPLRLAWGLPSFERRAPEEGLRAEPSSSMPRGPCWPKALIQGDQRQDHPARRGGHRGRQDCRRHARARGAGIVWRRKRARRREVSRAPSVSLFVQTRFQCAGHADCQENKLTSGTPGLFRA
jgi:hypothetical protein